MASSKGSSSKGDALKERAARLSLHGLVGRWPELGDQSWVAELIEIEEEERARRSLARRLKAARIGRFKPMADFDWSWPRKIDRDLVADLFALEFLGEAANVVLIGPNGVGKSTIAKNLAHQAVVRGFTVRVALASDMLSDLSSQDGPAALARRMRHYVRPALLVVDEVGYLSYNSHHADLFFDVINRRNEDRSTIVTTNKPFAEWNEVFPNSSSVVALVDRLVHRAEIVEIDGASWRLKEASERTEARRGSRKARAAATKERSR
jgi:DNA replication protein DnaC